MTTYIAYLFKFLFRIKWWLILCPALVASVVYITMKGMTRTYKSSTTIYTGLASGYSADSAETAQDWNTISNAMDNLINIIQSQSTLKNVSMRLYTKYMVHGDPEKDTEYITAANYREELRHTPEIIRKLIDRNDEEKTLQALSEYEQPTDKNHIYGLFHWQHRFCSYDKALRNIQVKRIGNSDMLELSYENTDPGIVYTTLELLNDEFVKQYKELRFGETNNVVAFFESELARIGEELRDKEDSLRDFNVENLVINYDEQTKHIASLSRDFELQYEEVRLNHNSAERLRETIEKQLGEMQIFRNNSAFIEKLHTIGDLQARITTAETFAPENGPQLSANPSDVEKLRMRLDRETDSLRNITSAISMSGFTKEGISTPAMVQQWMDAMLLSTKSAAQLEVLEEWKTSIDQRFEQFAPVGSMLKRKNRDIGFSENSYLSILSALNSARLKQKNLQMSSATLRVINPPVRAISAEPTKFRMMVYASFASTLIFILGFFLLLELLDRTLRDKIRTERITGGRVIGALPGPGNMQARRFTKQYLELAAKSICNSVFNYFEPTKRPCMVNILSTTQGDGKTQLTTLLAEHFVETGMKVRTVSWNKDFDISQKSFLMAERLDDFVHDTPEATPLSEADIVFIEFPPLDNSAIPRELLHQAALNIIVAPANRTWKSTDQLFYDKIVALSGATPTTICLNYAGRDVVETFTGLLPPYTYLRKLGYQISQFGFTSVK